MELVASASEMSSEHVWGVDSHANVHLSPYRQRFINYNELRSTNSIDQSKLQDGMGLEIPLLALDPSNFLAKMDADIDCPKCTIL